MAETYKFQKLQVYQSALDYVDAVYELTKLLPEREKFNLSSQIERAATSIALNIAEGSTGQTDAEQNRFLLTDQKTGELTERGRSIIAHTPMARFGTPADLVGAVLWLLSSAAAFVTGIIVPIDGGFSAYSGI